MRLKLIVQLCTYVRCTLQCCQPTFHGKIPQFSHCVRISILYSLWRIENVDIDVKRGIKVAMSVPRQNAVIASFRSLSIHQKQVGTFGANPSFRGHLRQPPLVLDLRRIPWGIEANVQGFTFYHSVRRIAFWRIESWFIWKNLIFLMFEAWFLICQLLFRPFAYFESVKIGPAIFLQCYQLYVQ